MSFNRNTLTPSTSSSEKFRQRYRLRSRPSDDPFFSSASVHPTVPLRTRPRSVPVRLWEQVRTTETTTTTPIGRLRSRETVSWFVYVPGFQSFWPLRFPSIISLTSGSTTKFHRRRKKGGRFQGTTIETILCMSFILRTCQIWPVHVVMFR